MQATTEKAAVRVGEVFDNHSHISGTLGIVLVGVGEEGRDEGCVCDCVVPFER